MSRIELVRAMVDGYLTCLREQAIPRCIHEHIDLFRALGEILAIRMSDKAVHFPDPKRRALMKLIWPERGPQ